MVGDSVLQKIISSYFFRSVLSADLLASVFYQSALNLAGLAAFSLTASKTSAFFAVSLLRAFAGAFDRQTSRLMGDSDYRFHLVDILSAGSARAGESYLQILGLDSCFSSVLTGKTTTEAVEVWTGPIFPSTALFGPDALRFLVLIYRRLPRPIFPKTTLYPPSSFF